jgi:hypothetical protein
VKAGQFLTPEESAELDRLRKEHTDASSGSKIKAWLTTQSRSNASLPRFAPFSSENRATSNLKGVFLSYIQMPTHSLNAAENRVTVGR